MDADAHGLVRCESGREIEKDEGWKLNVAARKILLRFTVPRRRTLGTPRTSSAFDSITRS